MAKDFGMEKERHFKVVIWQWAFYVNQKNQKCEEIKS